MKKIIYILLVWFVPFSLWSQTVQENVVKENYTLNGTEHIVAKQSITLKPNTWIQSGSVFSAKIIPDPYTALGLSNRNYVLTRTFQVETQTGNVLNNKDVIENITYFDGLGRAMQSIAIKQSPLQKDIVTHMTYDAYGRMEKEYLPYASTQNNGAYVSDALTGTNTYYTTHYTSDVNVTTPNPYSEKTFEASPLNRVFEQAAPGEDWKKTATMVTGRTYSNGHTLKMDYESNTLADEVRIFSVNTSFANNTYTPTLQGGVNYYQTGELTKMVSRDENWTPTDGSNHTTEEYTNGEGQLILKRIYTDVDLNSDGDFNDAGESQVRHDTYYVNDDFGNLIYVLPPKIGASLAILADVQNSLDDLGYQYKYDHRNRLVEKKIPGKGWESIVYDKLDRPVLTQNALMATQDEWLFTKYDAFGRVAYTGMYTSTANRTSLQTTVDTHSVVNETQQTTAITLQDGAQVYYSNNAFPNVATLELFTVNYYDTYVDVPSGLTAPSSVYSRGVSLNTIGLATVSKVRVLDSSASSGQVDWITTVTYYEDRGRPIYVYSQNNYLQTTDIVKTQINFPGRVLKKYSIHKKTGKSDIVMIDNFTYDHVGRLLTQTQQVNGQVAEMIAENVYNELGQLESKGVGNIASSANRLQTVNYNYNIRGWLQKINEDSFADNDLFNFSLFYNNPTGNGTALFNGNISQTSWNTLSADSSTKTYTYSYDALNRIIQGVDNTGNYNLNWVSYDKNGNINSLQRKGHNGTSVISGFIDDLTYNYDNGNKLLAVNDNGDGIYGFKDGANSSTEYVYDVNGNMTRDDNKGITAITYNHLNLPTQVTIGGQNINYIYDAAGAKQRKIVQGVTTDYADGYIYENGVLQFFSHAEGYIKPIFTGEAPTISSFDYIYQYKDHLGNVRLTYTDADGNESINATTEIIEESNYYPFGAKHAGYNNVISSNGNASAQKYKYNGKELQDELGLGWYNYGARNFDSYLGRWMNIDILAEKHYSVSPYDYVGANPILRIDLFGMDWYRDKDGNYHFSKALNSENAEYFLKEGQTYVGASKTVLGPGAGEMSKGIDSFILNSNGSITYVIGNKSGLLEVGQSMTTLGGQNTVNAYDDRPDPDETVNGETYESVDGNTYQFENNKWIKLSGLMMDISSYGPGGANIGTGGGYYASFFMNNRRGQFIDKNIAQEAMLENLKNAVGWKGLVSGTIIDWISNGELKLPNSIALTLGMAVNLFNGVIDNYNAIKEHDRKAKKIKEAKKQNNDN